MGLETWVWTAFPKNVSTKPIPSLTIVSNGQLFKQRIHLILLLGLDAARPLFTDRPPSLRLDPTDADIVDCIHTCGKYLGFYEPLCTHDFYPNGGKPIQPGCGLDWDGMYSLVSRERTSAHIAYSRNKLCNYIN